MIILFLFFFILAKRENWIYKLSFQFYYPHSPPLFPAFPLWFPVFPPRNLHFSDSSNSIYNWHVPSKWMGNVMHCNYFSVFFYEFSLAGSFYGKEKEDYNPLDYFRMEIIEEISFFFDREDPARSQKLCAEMMQKLKSKVRRWRRKKG